MHSLVLFALTLMASASDAQTPVPVWELGKHSPRPDMVTGKVEVVDGVVVLDGANTVSLPAALLGAQNDYTIEFEIKRPADMKQGCGFVMFSNADDKQRAGIKYAYYPPDYNCGWILKNGHMTVEQRGLLNDAFTRLTLVVKDKQLMQFRNGLLLAVTDTVNPSSQPLTFGGMLDARRAPQRYEFRNIRVYDQAIFPAGFDRHADRMRHVSGDQYTMQRVEVKDPSLPRILVMGDSISMGYRNHITEHFKGRAYVDYWVGSGCAWYGKSLHEKDSPTARAWQGVLSNGPYDVISWNAMTLHWWAPNMPDRCPEDSLATSVTETVQHLKQVAPQTQLIWVRGTPIRSNLPDGTPTMDNPGNARMVKFNKIVDEVLQREGVPEVDLYAIAENQLHTVRKGSQDTVHWGTDVSGLFAEAIIKEIEQRLPAKASGRE